MDNLRRWISYDTFKLIVSLLLLLLILFLAMRNPAASPTASAGESTQVGAINPTQTPVAATNTLALPTSTAPAQDASSPTAVPPTATQRASATLPAAATASATTTLPSATATLAATATLPPEPSPTATIITPTETPASPAQPEPTATSPAAPTATSQPPSTASDCPLAQPSRLAVGNQARVLTNLNLRQDAGMDKPIIQVWVPNTNVEVIGGPVCIPYQNGAYQWWNLQSADGITGWSAEGSLSSNLYFLEPVP